MFFTPQAPGSWHNTVSRILEEVKVCRGDSLTSREASCSLILPSDNTSYFLQQYLDQTVYRLDVDPGM